MGYDKEGRDEMAYFERQGDDGNAELDRIADSLRDEDEDPVCEACGDTGRVPCPRHDSQTCMDSPCPTGATLLCEVKCPDCPTCGCGARLTRANLDSHRECWRIP